MVYLFLLFSISYLSSDHLGTGGFLILSAPPMEADSEELGESVIKCSCKWNCAQSVKKADILCITEDMIPKLFSREQSLYNEV